MISPLQFELVCHVSYSVRKHLHFFIFPSSFLTEKTKQKNSVSVNICQLVAEGYNQFELGNLRWVHECSQSIMMHYTELWPKEWMYKDFRNHLPA